MTTIVTAALAGALFGSCIPSTRPENVWKHPSYQGVVLDARTGSPVPGASVTWEEGKLSTVTDDSGRFALPGDRGARVGMMCFGDSMENRTLLVSHPQYRDRRLQHRHVMNGDPIEDLGEITIAPRNP